LRVQRGKRKPSKKNVNPRSLKTRLVGKLPGRAKGRGRGGGNREVGGAGSKKEDGSSSRASVTKLLEKFGHQTVDRPERDTPSEGAEPGGCRLPLLLKDWRSLFGQVGGENTGTGPTPGRVGAWKKNSA